MQALLIKKQAHQSFSENRYAATGHLSFLTKKQPAPFVPCRTMKARVGFGTFELSAFADQVHQSSGSDCSQDLS